MSRVCQEQEPHSVLSSLQPESSPESKPLLLIIDDEEQLNRMLALHLEREYQVYSVTSGLQGLAAVEKLNPDCVLLDLHLPGMDGMEVLEKLQRLTPFPLVMIMTAYGEIRSAVQAINGRATLTIGIGGDLTASPLPHHRTYGSRIRRFGGLGQ